MHCRYGKDGELSSASSLFVKAAAVAGMAFFLFHGLLSFGYGVDFVDAWQEGDKYYLGEGEARAAVPYWIYRYHALYLVLFIPGIIVSLLATCALRSAGDVRFERYLRAAIGGCIASTFAWELVGPRNGHWMRLPGQLAVAASSVVVAMAIVWYRVRQDQQKPEDQA
jgi:uncharacterized membrane protein YdjX (TVP38/TMEM64 family)